MVEFSLNSQEERELWEKLLNHLDEMLQMGLLTQLRAIDRFSIKDDTLAIETSSPDNRAYLSKAPVLQQLQILARELVGVGKVKIN